MYGAISAGCTAALKVSEITPNYADLIAELLPKYLDSDAYRVVTGAVPEITRLLELKCKFDLYNVRPWLDIIIGDHIFYTGNGRVGRIISAAAAKHLTPLTLELGGKSPVIVDPNYDLDLAAKRIIWGKINNAGQVCVQYNQCILVLNMHQICVSPDHILTTPAAVAPLVAAIQKHLKAFYPDGALAADYYSRIVSELHFDRLKNLLAHTKGKVVIGGKVEEFVDAAKKGKKGGIEPTILVDIKEDDILMERCVPPCDSIFIHRTPFQRNFRSYHTDCNCRKCGRGDRLYQCAVCEIRPELSTRQLIVHSVIILSCCMHLPRMKSSKNRVRPTSYVLVLPCLIVLK